MTKLTQNSYVSMSLLLPFIGGVMWLANVHSEARSANEHVQQLEAGLMEYKAKESSDDAETRKLLMEILQRVSRIEARGK